MMNLPRIVGVVVALLALGAAASPARLEWAREPGTESCPDAAALVEVVHTRLGRTVFSSLGDGERLVTGITSREGRTWKVHLTLVGTDDTLLGQRAHTVVADDCRALADAAALIIALLVEVPEVLAPPSTPPLAVEPARPVLHGVREAPPPETPLVDRPSIAVGVVNGTGAGSLYGLGFFGWLSLRWRGWLVTSLGSEHWLTAPTGPIDARITRHRQRLEAGPSFAQGDYAVEPTVVLSLNELVAEGVGLENARSAVVLHGGLGVRLRLRADFGHFMFWTGPGLEVSLGQPRFVALTPEGPVTLYETPVVTFDLALGVGMRW